MYILLPRMGVQKNIDSKLKVNFEWKTISMRFRKGSLLWDFLTTIASKFYFFLSILYVYCIWQCPKSQQQQKTSKYILKMETFKLWFNCFTSDCHRLLSFQVRIKTRIASFQCIGLTIMEEAYYCNLHCTFTLISIK